MKKIYVFFRLNNFNRNSITALISSLNEVNNPQIKFIKDGNEIDNVLKLSELKVICYSFSTPELLNVKKEIAFIRSLKSSNCLLVAGGPHPTADPEGTLKLGFDYCFVGESEKTFCRFILKIQKREFPAGSIIFQGNEIVDINDYYPVLPKYNLVPPLEITRGCIRKCSYCQTPDIFGNKLRHRNIENVFKSLKIASLNSRKRTWFISPNAFSYGTNDYTKPSVDSIKMLLEIARKAGINEIFFGSFPAEVCPESVNEEILQIVKRYCKNKRIIIGVQSVSERTLKSLNRFSSISEIKRAVYLVKKTGFIPVLDFIFGLPDENESEIRETLTLISYLIKEYRAQIHAHTYIPLPSTPFWHKEPVRLKKYVKEFLLDLEYRKKLFGDWKEQEILSKNILKWKEKGLITV